MRTIQTSPLLILALTVLLTPQASTQDRPPNAISAIDTDNRIAKAIDNAVAAAREVAAMESIDNIKASRQAAVVHHAAALLLSAGRDREAEPWLQIAVRLAPHRMDWQWSLAQVLDKQGNPKKAKSLAQLVYDRAESGKLISESAAYLGIKPQWGIPSMAEAAAGRSVIRIMTAGEVQPWLLHAAATSIQTRLGVPVHLAAETIELGEPDRTNAESVAAEARGNIFWDSAFTREVMKELDIRSPETATDQQVVELLATLMLEAGHKTSAVNWLTAYAAESTRPQWQAKLLAGKAGNAMREPGANGPRVLLTVVLTEADLYDLGNNYLFALYWSPPPGAVVSAARFMADFYGTAPARPRMQQRLEKQLLASIGHAAHVPRCSDPRCVRAYPASLDEFDAKGNTYCPDCKTGLETFLGRKLPSTRE